jgi:hypothetical protein
MKRISDEDGMEAGGRNVGRLALSLIPWALGIGALVWLGVWIGIHEFRHELSQEERAAIYVGAKERPHSRLIINTIKSDCSTVTRADLDGSDLIMYAKNDCHETLRYLAWRWQLLSPDGTVLKEEYVNGCPVPRMPGDSAECRMQDHYASVSDDDRAATVRVWTQITP